MRQCRLRTPPCPSVPRTAHTPCLPRRRADRHYRAVATVRPSTHRGRRILLWVIAAFLVIVAAAFVAVRVLLPPERVRALVQAQLARVIDREVRYSGASVGLWPPVRLSVETPAIGEPEGLARGTILEARAIHLDLDVFALLSRRVLVRRLVLDHPSVHVLMRADGTTNLDHVLKPQPSGAAGGGKPMDVDLRELEILDGRALIDDQQAARRIAFALGSRVALSALQGGTRLKTSGTTEIGDLRLGPSSAARISDLDPSLAKLRLRIVHDGAFDATQKRLALGKLALDLGKTSIQCSGVIDDPGPKGAIDMRAKGSAINLGDVLSYLAVADAAALHGLSGTGRLDFDLRAVGRLGQPRPPAVIGTLRISGGQFRYPNAPAGVDGLHFTARLTPDSLMIGDLRARVGNQPLAATLFATHLADPWVRFTMQGDVDLAAVAPLVAPKDTKLAGRMALHVAGSGHARDPGAMALDGAATLKGVSVQSPKLPNRLEDVHGDLRFSQERASVTGFGARAGKSSFNVDATVTRPLALMAGMNPTPGQPLPAPANVDFHLTSPYMDLAEIMPGGGGGPVLPNATGGGSVSIGRFRNQRLDVQNLTARIALQPQVMEVPEYAMRGYGGHVKGHARFDLRDPAKPSFDAQAIVDTLSADAILSSFSPAKNLIHGELSTNVAIAGIGATPADLKRTITAIGTALIADGTIGPGPTLDAIARAVHIPAFRTLRFRDAKVPFRVVRGAVVTDPVVLDGPNGEWKLIGSVGFDGNLDYAVSTTLPKEVAARLGANAALAAGALSDAQGRILIDLRVRGPASSPQVTWDPGAMRDRLAGRVSQAIEEQRARLDSTARATIQQQQQAAEDSVRRMIERQKRSATDSLSHKAGDLLNGFFGRAAGGGAAKPGTPSTAKRDTVKRDTTKRDTTRH
jgi:hypothetical protein